MTEELVQIVLIILDLVYRIVSLTQ
jgi:hypothetical protein